MVDRSVDVQPSLHILHRFTLAFHGGQYSAVAGSDVRYATLDIVNNDTVHSISTVSADARP